MDRLRHPGLVGLERFYVEPEQVVLVLELMQGGTLLDLILDQGPLPEHEARAAMRAILGALAHLHAHQVAHRDVKPDNVMLPTAGAVAQAQLHDPTPGLFARPRQQRNSSQDEEVSVCSFDELHRKAAVGAG